MKYMTPSEAATKRDQAAELMRRLGRDDEAERFERMGLGEYAETKGAQLLENPTRRRTKAMAREPGRAALSETLDQIADGLEEALDPELTREELVGKLKELADIASGEDADEEKEEDEDDED